ncbi:MAG: hypothetical protein Q7U04_05055, partial [Bacteriovorax sp.]|nr:hypothetical protein [Bacteriovorax sp.]
MKGLLYSIFFSLLILSTHSVCADTCSDALDEFNNEGQDIVSKKLVSYENLKTFYTAFEKMQIITESEPCYKATLEASQKLRLELKQKRIATINFFISQKSFEEAGTDIVAELGVLTGKKIKSAYAFDELFSIKAEPKNNSTKPNRSYEAAVVIAKESKTNLNIQNSCTDKINQNAAVNLNNVRNQDDVGWCYAYAGADLLSYRLNKIVSAVSLYSSGQTIERDINSLIGNGGNIKSAIDNYLALNKGICLEEDLPSSDFKFCTHRDYADFLKALYKSAANTLSNDQCLEENLKQAFPSANLGMINDILKSNNGSYKLVES